MYFSFDYSWYSGHCDESYLLAVPNCVLASYLSDFTHKITECCKQELTSCVISLIPNFLAGFMKRNVSDRAVQCDLCDLWVY